MKKIIASVLLLLPTAVFGGVTIDASSDGTSVTVSDSKELDNGLTVNGTIGTDGDGSFGEIGIGSFAGSLTYGNFDIMGRYVEEEVTKFVTPAYYGWSVLLSEGQAGVSYTYENLTTIVDMDGRYAAIYSQGDWIFTASSDQSYSAKYDKYKVYTRIDVIGVSYEKEGVEYYTEYDTHDESTVFGIRWRF